MTKKETMLEESVARHYNDDPTFNYESVRLTEYAPIEFGLTKRYLDKSVPVFIIKQLSMHDPLWKIN